MAKYNIANMYIANRDRAETGGGGGSNINSRVSALELTVDGDSTASPPVVGLVDTVDMCGKYSLLWENEDPTASMSSSDTITLSSGDYDMLLVFVNRSTSVANMFSEIVLSGSNVALQCVNYIDGHDRVTTRTLTRSSSTEYIASDADYDGTTTNTSVIPVKIYGIKF